MYIILLIVAVMVGVMGLLVLGTSIQVHKRTCPHVMRSLEHFPPEAWEQLNNKTIFFGHKSVGYNIIDGIRDIAASHGFLNLRVVETNNVDQIEGPILVVCNAYITGYKCFNFIRASAVVNCQSTVAPALLR